MTEARDLAPRVFADYPLRARKRARVRVGLWTALRDRIEHVPFADISVRELAAAVEISEPTFFAHFSAKSDLLAYHVAMWRIGTVLQAAAAPDGAAFLRRFFDETGRWIVDGPRMWFEVTAEVARGAGVCEAPALDGAERLLAFDDPAALDVQVTSQADLFAHHLTIARRQGESTAPVTEAVTGLLTGFYGVPLALGRAHLDHLHTAYRAHLDRFLTTGGGQ